MVKPWVEDIERLRKFIDENSGEEAWAIRLQAGSALRNASEAIEKELAPYCAIARCIRRYDAKYSFDNNINNEREHFAVDVLRMLERQEIPEELRSDNRIQLLRLACASVWLVLVLYLLGAFILYARIGWRRLAALTALVAPLCFVAFALAVRELNPLYGTWDLAGPAVGTALLICVLYPFVVIPPLWILNKKANRGVWDAVAYWRTQPVT